MNVPFLDLSRQHKALRDEVLAALAATYDANRFCLGRDVEDFERAFAAASGASDCVGVNNGTTALHLVARALEIGPGDEVIVPAFTFIASAWTASYVGARPVFADIDLETFTLDPAQLDALVTPRTRAIVVVHLFGQPARMDEILAVAAKHRLPVIEDCAQAHLASYRGRPVGTMGDAGTFSFYPTKNLGACGEGGAIVSRRPEILAASRLMRVHGSNVRYRHDTVGYNYRMEGFQAAALNVKLGHLQAWTARRREIARRYSAGIRLADTAIPVVLEIGESVYHQYTIRHPRRDALREHLARLGVGTDLIYPAPLHLQPCYAELGYAPGSVPVAEEAARTVLSLPIFAELTDAEIDHVVAAVNSF
ncbi:DegT/DnrJ/EryC1/StrS family aminotransferase [Opitutales bacterium ASA1]|uniref:DegT/DnrJ/EryC1/StrS family aminotransferase n=1 Tax=Congregicoccus parvus TaxID=3081749 RepID=UPI002B2DB6B7|nr:DegT/DnrJ/EryC1/StrS family aminotransferase [Opitutales bacterium ASA1]